MREILFRGKRQDNGEWIEGCLIRVYERICRAVYQPREYAIQSAEDWIAPRYVVAKTVGQYTGLKDKNDKRIFEGDIVELEDRYCDIKWRAVIEFGNPNGNYSWGWQLNPIGKVDINTDILCWVEMEDTGAFCEVIGTIYDNPELLEVGE